MFKKGREYIKGHRTEWTIIQLFILLCWLFPVAVELFLRRLAPPTALWRNILLIGSFLLNRFLLAPAHTGYYACCRRLAATVTPQAATSEIEDLREEMTAPTLLSCFFLDYGHPLKSVKWQLRYDAFRFFIFALFLFPAVFFVAVGAREESALLQAVCAGGGILCGIIGLFLAFLLLLLIQPMLYRRPQYGPFWRQLCNAVKTTSGHGASLLVLNVKFFPLSVLSFCPFMFFRVFLLTEQAILLSKVPVKKKKQRRRLFHTRVLRDA